MVGRVNCEMPLMRCQWLVTVTLVAFCLQLALLFRCCSASSANTVNMENDVLHFSYELEQWLDTEVHPCDDFFAYVCGKSLNTTKAQSEQRLQQEQRKFEKFLENNIDQLMDAELKLKYFYEACKNARSLDELKGSLMYRTSGGWPAVDDGPTMIRKRRNLTWLGVLSAFHDVGVEYIFDLRIEIKSNKRIVHLEPETSSRYTLRKFEQLADVVMKEHNVEASRARLVALEILNFERSRREIMRAEVADNSEQESTYTGFKSTVLNNVLHLEWDKYFKKIIGKPLKPTDTVRVKDLPKLLKYFELLQNTTMTRLLNWIWIDYLMDKSSDNCQELSEHHFEPIYQHIVQRAAIDKVQMAQMYAALGSSYDQLLPGSPWIDEMSHQNSKQFLGRILHLTLNGDAKLDADFAALTMTSRNLYRNLEKIQRHRVQMMRNQASAFHVSGNSIEIMEAAKDYMKVFASIGALLSQQNLTTPLNYLLVGEHFAERMIAAGGRAATPGAWRSMDSEREFAALEQCIQRTSDPMNAYNLNSLLLKLLANEQAEHAFGNWLEQSSSVVQRLESLLAAGRLKLSMRKLQFISALLTNCQLYGEEEQKKILYKLYLKNSRNFSEIFECRHNDPLYSRNVCRVL